MNNHNLFHETTWAVVRIGPEKIQACRGIWTHDLCDTGAALYQPSWRANR